MDTLRVGGEIHGVDEAAAGWKVSLETTAAGYRVVRRLRSLPCGAVLDARGDTAWVEASAPKLSRGVNFPAVPVAEAVAALVAVAQDEAGQFVNWTEPPRTVNRADLVRDFDSVPDLSAVLSGLALVPPTDSRVKTHLYRDSSRNRAETLSCGFSRAGGGRLYDKFTECGVAEAAGVLRFEAEERKPTLRRAGVLTVGDLTAEACYDLARGRFDRCRFGTLLRPIEGFKVAVVGLYGQCSTGLAVYGAARLQAEGESWPWSSRQMRSKWLKMVRAVGAASVAPVTYWLDFDYGVMAA